MITANELRRRNLVYRASDKSIEVVNTIFCNSVCLQGCNDNFYCQEIDPIPLTPEILEKAGFENSINEDEDDMFIKNYIRLDYMEFSTAEDNGFYYDNGSPNETKISFVHQLQNLYYALTGTELQIIL